MAELEKPSNLSLIWADAGDKIQPSEDKVRTGWLVEIPTRQNFNWLDNRQDQALAHINQRGIPEWDRNTSYVFGKSYVQGSDGIVYFAKADSTGVDPTNDSSGNFWVEAFLTEYGYGSGRRFVGYEVFSSSFVATNNHRYYLSAPLTVTLGAAIIGDAVEFAKNPSVVVTVVDSTNSESYQLNSDNKTTFVYSMSGWVKLDEDSSSSSGVSLKGPTTVLANSSNVYTITDYNSFSSYSVSSSTGSVSISGETITLTLTTVSGNEVVLSVEKDDVAYNFVIGLGAQSVATPSITYPSQGQGSVELSPTLSSTAFATLPAGQDTHQSSQWQVASDANFTNIVFDSGITTTNKTSVNIPSGTLSQNSQYFVRVRYTGVALGVSSWSSVREFTTTDRFVDTPSVTVTGGPSSVGETPTITGSAFAVTGGSDTHNATDWQIVKVSDGSVVWESLGNTTNKNSILVPASRLIVSTQYKARVRYAGSVSGYSGWGEYSFTTRSQFFNYDSSSAGLPLGGGYYAGNIRENGIDYALIVAPKSQGGERLSGYPVVSDGSANGPTNSTYDGALNTAAMTDSKFIAASFCRGLSINGYTDWYLPSLYELEICYRYLKPTTDTNAGYNPNFQYNPGQNPYAIPPTSAYTASNPSQCPTVTFKAGGSEAFTDKVYASSYLQNQPSRASVVISFKDGRPDSQNYNTFDSSVAVRAIRKQPI